ncbi:hypothetical protein [Thermococcus sp.]|uniref:hypothetical protein n=1 Tax=Thermococcus sp. TaxID=35749 RepID=UPI0026130538|nr:hypothetical protein [Thermococcus sp.]
MGKWVNIRISFEAAVPLETLPGVAPGIDVEEFLELLEDDPDEAIEMLKEYLIVGETTHYGVDFDVEDAEVYEE